MAEKSKNPKKSQKSTVTVTRVTTFNVTTLAVTKVTIPAVPGALLAVSAGPPRSPRRTSTQTASASPPQMGRRIDTKYGSKQTSSNFV